LTVEIVFETHSTDKPSAYQLGLVLQRDRATEPVNDFPNGAEHRGNLLRLQYQVITVGTCWSSHWFRECC
jgi:hypothetical protein